ncbi:MAG: hypothetical protein HKN07_13745 [Acidimicrobiia bacterium]|nr:hypothetical protein [Acidimicrobiia bacterium]
MKDRLANGLSSLLALAAVVLIVGLALRWLLRGVLSLIITGMIIFVVLSLLGASARLKR